MAKTFTKNGITYKSYSAYVRSLRGRFAGLPYHKKQRVLRSGKTVRTVIRTEIKRKKHVDGKGFVRTTNEIEKVKTIYPKQTGPQKIELKTKTDTYRVNTVARSDPETGDFFTTEVEEASRYTPAELDYKYTDLGQGVTETQGIKQTGDTKRIVTATSTNDVAQVEKEVQHITLRDKFEDWQKGEGPRLATSDLVTLGRSIGVDVGGGNLKHPRATFEKRISKKLAEEKQGSSKTDITERYYKLEKLRMAKGEEPKVLDPNVRTKAPKYENQEEINTIINKAYDENVSKKVKHERPKIDEMEILLGARKTRPDKNYNSSQLKQGIKTEKEHTANTEVAKTIAKDHLDEDPKYYTKLAQVEKK